jgi:hypothetical protein
LVDCLCFISHLWILRYSKGLFGTFHTIVRSFYKVLFSLFKKRECFLVILKLSWLWWSVFFFSVAEKRQTHRDRETKPERELGFVSIVLELESLV